MQRTTTNQEHAFKIEGPDVQGHFLVNTSFPIEGLVENLQEADGVDYIYGTKRYSLYVVPGKVFTVDYVRSYIEQVIIDFIGEKETEDGTKFIDEEYETI